MRTEVDDYVIGIAAELEDYSAAANDAEHSEQLAGRRVAIARHLGILLRDLDPSTLRALRRLYRGDPAETISEIVIEGRRRDLGEAHLEHGLLIGVAYRAAALRGAGMVLEEERIGAAADVLARLDEDDRGSVFYYLTGKALAVTVPGWKRTDRIAEVIGHGAQILDLSVLDDRDEATA